MLIAADNMNDATSNQMSESPSEAKKVSGLLIPISGKTSAAETATKVSSRGVRTQAIVASAKMISVSFAATFVSNPNHIAVQAAMAGRMGLAYCKTGFNAVLGL